jgi:hypothetical protein
MRNKIFAEGFGLRSRAGFRQILREKFIALAAKQALQHCGILP